MRPKLAVFDVAGTTVLDDDDAVGSKVCEALAEDGIETGLDDVNPLMGMPKPLAVTRILEQQLGLKPESERVERVHRRFQSLMIEHYRTSPTVEPMPGAVTLFEELRRHGCRVALDTGFDRPTLNTILERLEWGSQVDDTITSDEVIRGRPHTDMIDVLMQRAGVVDPAAVWKVGDSVSDLDQGLAAHCGLVVAVLGVRTRPVIDNYPDVMPISSLDELLPLVRDGRTPKAGEAAS